jgi:hypothetical protein
MHNDGTVRVVLMIVVMTAGTAVIMWLGELITDRGIGNGMSRPDLHPGRRDHSRPRCGAVKKAPRARSRSRSCW